MKRLPSWSNTMNCESLSATMLLTQSEMWVLADSTILTFVCRQSFSSNVAIPLPVMSPTMRDSLRSLGLGWFGAASLTMD